MVEFLADKNLGVQYNQQIEQRSKFSCNNKIMSGDRDIHFEEAGKFIIEKASIVVLQRMFKIGFNKSGKNHGSALRRRCSGTGRGNKEREKFLCLWRSFRIIWKISK